MLPLRWNEFDAAAVDELTDYLRDLHKHAEILVVDGSPPAVYEAHARAWGHLVRHLPPDPAYAFANGKVNGVHTGVVAATHEHVVLADDDVRHTPATIEAIDRALHTASVVRPQNYFDPLPWHARWDTARSLLNRAVGADYPGTLAVRRSMFTAMGGYDGDVLFENLELMRTVSAAGGIQVCPLDLYVRRLPPEADRFWQQRVRQAYDDFAQPVRLAGFLSVLPAVAWAVGRRRPAVVLGAAFAAMAVAEVGRRRAGGRRVFPASTSALAPVWILERAVCGWLAVGLRLTRGGVPYAGRRLRIAAHSEPALRRRVAGRRRTPTR